MKKKKRERRLLPRRHFILFFMIYQVYQQLCTITSWSTLWCAKLTDNGPVHFPLNRMPTENTAIILLLQYIHWVVLQDQVRTVKARDCSFHFMYTSTIIKVMQDEINSDIKTCKLDGNYKKGRQCTFYTTTG